MVIETMIIGALSATVLLQVLLHPFDRRRYMKREDKYIKAILSKNAGEYDAATTTTNDTIKELKAESKMAESAVKLERAMNDEPHPGIIPVS